MSPINNHRTLPSRQPLIHNGGRQDHRNSSPASIGAVATLVLATTLPSPGLSQPPAAQVSGEIRVDTNVYLKGAAQPIQTNRTLFADSSKGWRTYDFVLGKNPETTILDMGDAPHFAMISSNRGVMCIVPLLRVDEFAAQQRARANFAPKFEISQTGELLTLKIRYKERQGVESRLLEFPILDDGRALDDASADFKFAAAVAQFGMILRRSEHGREATIDDVRALALQGLGADERGYRAGFIDLVDRAARLVD